ncbi:MAG: phosphatase PAP2 family protein [Deltaproteobacteria bacterium]|nr:phosphatase PAP2 family protein [Deltaproteobacteria bacterium]
MTKWTLGAIGALGALLVTAPAHGAEPATHGAQLRWDDAWPRFRVSEAVVTTVAAAGLVTLYVTKGVAPTWGRPVLFDGAMRRSFKYDSEAERDFWQQSSTWAYYTMIAYPLLIDGLAVPLARRSPDVALQMTLINLEVFAVTGFVFRVSETLLRRARPYVWDCMEATGNVEQCREHGASGTTSLVSGHVALAAAGAAVTCTHHANLSLYGSPAADAAACAVGIAVTTGVGVGRLIADNHYTTDILAGALVGGATGYLIPKLLHYRSPKLGTPAPRASAHSIGIDWVGLF